MPNNPPRVNSTDASMIGRSGSVAPAQVDQTMIDEHDEGVPSTAPSAVPMPPITIIASISIRLSMENNDGDAPLKCAA